MKTLILALLLIVPAVVMPGQPNQRPDANQNPAKGKDPTAITFECNDCTQAHAGEASAKPPKWYAPLKRPEWWLVALGFFTLWLIWLQAKRTAEAARAAQNAADATKQSVAAIEGQSAILKESVVASKKSADAAELSAKAAIGIAVPTLKVIGFEFGADPSNPSTFEWPKTEIVVKNCGSTPAFLLYWNLNYALQVVGPDDPLGDGHTLERVVVEPNQTCTLKARNIWPRLFISLDDAKAIIDRTKIFVVYGYVCYGSVFDDIPLRRLRFYEVLLNIFASGADIGNWISTDYNEYISQKQQSQKAN